MSDTANILLVDDEPGMLRYIRTLLEVDEYKVETASTGEQALERVQKGLHPDLVLLDLLMPGIDGLQTLEQLRQLQAGSESGDVVLRRRYPKSCAGDAAGRVGLPHQAFSESGIGCGGRSMPGKQSAELCREKWKNLRTTYFSSPPAPRCAASVASRIWSPTSIFLC